VADEELGSTPEEIHESFPRLPLATIQGIPDFAHKHQPGAVSPPPNDSSTAFTSAPSLMYSA
jgi:hypothetical protein